MNAISSGNFAIVKWLNKMAVILLKKGIITLLKNRKLTGSDTICKYKERALHLEFLYKTS